MSKENTTRTESTAIKPSTHGPLHNPRLPQPCFASLHTTEDKQMTRRNIGLIQNKDN